jgi:uncharacterized membrane protein YhaH (DUF805 family)
MLMKYYILGFKKILNFRSEATLNEFWMFFVFNIFVNVIFTIICKKLNFHEYVYQVYRIASVLAFISLGFRRLKNAGYPGWLFLIPIVNLILASMPEKEILKN